MIKIDGANIDGVQKSLEEFAKDFFKRINPKCKNKNYKKTQSIVGRLECEIRRNSPISGFCCFLLDKRNDYQMLKKTLTCSPYEMVSEIIPYFTDKATELGIDWNANVHGTLNKHKLIKVLNYDNFRKNHAIWLVRSLGLKTCPYCNNQPVLTYSNSKSSKALCQLDHFFPKERYPYLSISFFNLIPTCSYCNHIKSSLTPDVRTWYHPYVYNLSELFRFKGKPTTAIQHLLDGKPITAEIEYKVEITNDEKNLVDNHFETFSLLPAYKNHNDVIEEIYWKGKYYNATRRKELINLFGQTLDLKEADIDRFILGNYSQEKDYLKRPLAKLTADIAEEINLISKKL